MFTVLVFSVFGCFRDSFVAEEIYQGFRVATTTGDQNYIKGNAKYFAFPAGGGGGPICIRRHNTPGRMPSQLPLLTGHKYEFVSGFTILGVIYVTLISIPSTMNRSLVLRRILQLWYFLFLLVRDSCGSSRKEGLRRISASLS